MNGDIQRTYTVRLLNAVLSPDGGVGWALSSKTGYPAGSTVLGADLDLRRILVSWDLRQTYVIGLYVRASGDATDADYCGFDRTPNINAENYAAPVASGLLPLDVAHELRVRVPPNGLWSIRISDVGSVYAYVTFGSAEIAKKERC